MGRIGIIFGLKFILPAKIYLNSFMQTSWPDCSPLLLPNEPLTIPKYSPSGNACMSSLQEMVSSPWTARVCSSDQPTYAECWSQTKHEQAGRGLSAAGLHPITTTHLTASQHNKESPVWSLEITSCPTSGNWGELPGWAVFSECHP